MIRLIAIPLLAFWLVFLGVYIFLTHAFRVAEKPLEAQIVLMICGWAISFVLADRAGGVVQDALVRHMKREER